MLANGLAATVDQLVAAAKATGEDFKYGGDVREHFAWALAKDGLTASG
jgi:hypothetical protein